MARGAKSASWNDHLTDRLAFEREARQAGRSFAARRVRDRHGALRWRYDAQIEIPAYDEQRRVRILLPAYVHQRPTVTVDGPFCGRHRFRDGSPKGSLCMWWSRDGVERRWVAADGLLALIEHAVEHCYCEASCRHGDGWPKPEAPGTHPKTCPTCRPC